MSTHGGRWGIMAECRVRGRSHIDHAPSLSAGVDRRDPADLRIAR
jgi:hypothetical protein